MKKIPVYLFVMILGISLSLLSCSSQNPLQVKDSYREDLVAKGWRLIRRWDFYNEIESWNHKMVTKVNSGGFVQVEDGVFEFGYSVDGGSVFFENKVKVIPKYSYMVLARVKTINPYQAMVGFRSPERKDILGGVRIRSENWHIVKSILSISPISGEKRPKRVYPTIHNLTREDYTYVDWVEFWIYPTRK